MLFGHDEGKNIKQLCDGDIDAICREMGGTGIKAKTAEELILALGGTIQKEIWKNASPTSTFPAQLIPNEQLLEVPSEGDIVKIKYRTSNTSNYISADEGELGEQISMHVIGQASSKIWGAYRIASITAEGIQFGVGTGVTPAAASEMNANIIPVAMYIIKGVQ